MNTSIRKQGGSRMYTKTYPLRSSQTIKTFKRNLKTHYLCFPSG
jgi:hypothetical protein